MKMKLTALAISIAFGMSATMAFGQDYGGAEDQQQQDPGMEQPQQQADFSDEELQQFVNLQDDIGAVREEYVSRIENADSEDEARQLQQEAQSEMVDTIEEAGMSVQEYNAIAVAYNSNPEIQERVEAMSD